jgi:hypothetical protein
MIMRNQKKVVPVILCTAMLLCACNGGKVVDGNIVEPDEPVSTVVEADQSVQVDTVEQSEESEETTGYTEEQAFEAARNYMLATAGIIDEDTPGQYWDVSTDENGVIVVLYHSYTGAINRYYVDATTGDTYVTEQVPGIIDDEQETGETFNIKDYLESAE